MAATKPSEERRRGARLQQGKVEHVEQTSIWIFGAALLLPVGLMLGVLVLIRTQRYFVARKPPSRWLFTTCAITLSALSVKSIGANTSLTAWLASGRAIGSIQALVATSGGMAAAIGSYFLVQAVLAGLARGLMTGRWALQNLIGTKDDNVLILYTLLLAVFAVIAEAFTPVALIAVVLVAIRNTRSEQRMSQLRSERERLEVDALHDSLTGLANRRGFEPQAELALLADTAEGKPTAVLMADLDHFKAWNTRLGHFGADNVLTAVAHTLRSHIRSSDLLCRWGGEEILVALPATTRAEAIALAERLRTAVAELSVRVSKPAGGADTVVTGCTLSLGAAVSPDDGSTLRELQEVADQALQQAKDTGRNRVCDAPQIPRLPRQRGHPQHGDTAAAPDQRR